MPRSVYFSQAVRSEQELYEDLIIESLKIYGQDVYYIPRTLVNRDDILNEDPASKFDDAFIIEAYLENVDGFDSTTDLYSKFGLEIRDEAQFVISRKVWNRRVGLWETDINAKPKEGDLLFLPMTNKFFEIGFVEDDKPFYQLSNLPVFKLTCTLFEYSDEDFDTGIEVIQDQTNESFQKAMQVTLGTENQHFEVEEIISQSLGSGVTISAEVAQRTKVSSTLETLYLTNITVVGATTYKEFTLNGTVTGAANSYTGTISTLYNDVTDATGTAWGSDEQAQNVDFELSADGFLDFSEANPFGDPSETY